MESSNRSVTVTGASSSDGSQLLQLGTWERFKTAANMPHDTHIQYILSVCVCVCVWSPIHVLGLLFPPEWPCCRLLCLEPIVVVLL